MRKSLFLAVTIALALTPLAGRAQEPLTQAPCAGTVAGPQVWKQMGNDVLENLLFAHGSLWISDGTQSRVVELDEDGNDVGGLSGISSPGGLAKGPAGLIYAGEGNSLANAILKTGAAQVVRFDPDDPNGTEEVYASGFNMPNGMTFGPGNDLFISNDLDFGLIRIPRSNPAAWAEYAHVWGTNGLVVDPAGENLYAAITFDQRSPIERISLDGSGAHETFVQLSLGVLSLEPAVHTDPDLDAPLIGLKGLDDMTRDAAGNLYVVANGMGELLRVEPDGDACLIASGLQNPSSVRIAPAASAFDTSGEAMTFYVTEFSGAIRTIGFTPA